jgi:hypothetical protein
MHIHNVYFWLKDDLDPEEVAAFEKGLMSLCYESNVDTGHYGKPADTNRSVVDNSFNFGLMLIFPDTAAHDRYQHESHVHDNFIEENNHKWERVTVYDILA